MPHQPSHLSLRAKPALTPLAGVAVACSLLASCGDDPELVRQRDEQRLEIRRLEGELLVLREKLRNPPKDRTAEIKALKKQISTEKGDIERLESELAELESTKRKLISEYEEYQRRYQLR